MTTSEEGKELENVEGQIIDEKETDTDQRVAVPLEADQEEISVDSEEKEMAEPQTSTEVLTEESSEQPELNDDNLFAEELMEDGEEDRGKKILDWAIRFVIVTIVIFVVGFTYFLYPFTNKLQGDWKTLREPNLQMNVKGKKFEVSAPANVTGGNLLLRGKLKGAGVNRYQGENISVVLSIDKGYYSNEEVSELKKDNNEYKVKKETKKVLELAFDDSKVRTLLKTDDIDLGFVFNLNYHIGEEKEKEIEWTNKVFTDEIIRLNKVEKNK